MSRIGKKIKTKITVREERLKGPSDEEIRRKAEQERKKLMEEMEKTKSLHERSCAINILNSINQEVLNGKGKITSNTGVYEFEDTRGNSEILVWSKTIATIAELRWARDNKLDNCIGIGTDTKRVYIDGWRLPRDRSYVKEARLFFRENTYRCGFKCDDLSNIEIQERIEDIIADLFMKVNYG